MPTTVEPPDRRGLSDDTIEQMLGNVLRYGVLVAAAVAFVGGTMYLVRYGHTAADYRVFGSEPVELRTLSSIVAGSAALRSRWIIQFGLVLLIALPILRVALSLIAFVIQRDRLYVVLTAVVLALLTFGLLSGRT